MSNNLSSLREKLNELDTQLINILSQRYEVSKMVGKIKRYENLKALDEEQAKKKQDILVKKAKSLGLRGKYIRKIWRNIHHESVKIQKEIMGDVHLLQKLEEKKEKLENRINKRSKK